MTNTTDTILMTRITVSRVEDVEFGDFADFYPDAPADDPRARAWAESSDQWDSEREELLASTTRAEVGEHLSSMSRIEREWGDDPSTREVCRILGF